MAELFNPQSESAALQGAIARLRTAHGKVVAAPATEPLFHTDVNGGLVHRDGRPIRPALTPVTFGKKG